MFYEGIDDVMSNIEKLINDKFRTLFQKRFYVVVKISFCINRMNTIQIDDKDLFLPSL